MQTDIEEMETHSPGRLIVEYLQNKAAGATVPDIVQHLRDEHTDCCGKLPGDLNKTVQSVLADGATLGFLERKGSKFMCWVAKEMCGMRARRCRSRRRRRRRRSQCSRRRRPRRCSRRTRRTRRSRRRPRGGCKCG